MPKLSYLVLPGALATGLFFVTSSFDGRDGNDSDTSTFTAGLPQDLAGFAQGINTVLYDESGEPSYTLQAERQIQRDDDTADLTRPVIQLHSSSQAQWNIVADSGSISARQAGQADTSRRITLTGNVEVYSLDEFGNRTVLSTEHLTILPRDETAETDRSVRLDSNTIQQTSQGMFANLGANEFTFLRDSTGRYEDPPR